MEGIVFKRWRRLKSSLTLDEEEELESRRRRSRGVVIVFGGGDAKGGFLECAQNAPRGWLVVVGRREGLRRGGDVVVEISRPPTQQGCQPHVHEAADRSGEGWAW